MPNPLALIIEDEQTLADLFATALQRAEFDTEVYHDGQEALTRLGEIVPDVIVLDLYLPNVSGRTILEYVRSEERLSQTRVLLATADAALADSLRSQVDISLLKPINFSQLRDLAWRLRPTPTDAH